MIKKEKIKNRPQKQQDEITKQLCNKRKKSNKEDTENATKWFTYILKNAWIKAKIKKNKERRYRNGYK